MWPGRASARAVYNVHRADARHEANQLHGGCQSILEEKREVKKVTRERDAYAVKIWILENHVRLVLQAEVLTSRGFRSTVTFCSSCFSSARTLW